MTYTSPEPLSFNYDYDNNNDTACCLSITGSLTQGVAMRDTSDYGQRKLPAQFQMLLPLLRISELRQTHTELSLKEHYM